ncbi:MAG: AzlC family ABC transporter permease [Lachnospiraceae bacterium]|nr:AzlC family ABC transporter permease [Lachnospiraceae bacterium]
MRDGMPICLGYFAVAFSLGIAARRAGIDAFQGFLMSFLNNASAGEYALITTIAADAGYLEAAVITLVANARYLLMSTALSQRFSPDEKIRHRLLVSYDITDELFGIAIAREGYLEPMYSYGAFAVAIPGWAFGTAFGIIMGNLLPALIVKALGVALYGMFLAIIIPPAKKDKIVGVLVVISFAASFVLSRMPVTADWSEGTRTILLTILIAGAAAVLFPKKEEE